MLLRGFSDKTKERFFKNLGIKNEWENPCYALLNYKEIDAEIYWSWKTSQSHLGEAHDLSGYHNKQRDIFLFYMNIGSMLNGGFMITVERQSYPKPSLIRYFQWTPCVHDFRQTNIGNCLNKYTCVHCGANETIDSSD